MVRDKKAPPMGMPPRKKEMRKEIKPIQTISPKGMTSPEYERKITMKAVAVTRAVPPRAKTEKTGAVTAAILRFKPRLSLRCFIATPRLRFMSPEKKAVIRLAVLA